MTTQFDLKAGNDLLRQAILDVQSAIAEAHPQAEPWDVAQFVSDLTLAQFASQVAAIHGLSAHFAACLMIDIRRTLRRRLSAGVTTQPAGGS